MRILHILDHSLPLHSGYTFRTKSIVDQQQAFGWDTFHLTTPKQGHTDKMEETAENLHFYRTRGGGLLSKLPVLNQWSVIRATAARLEQLVKQLQPDVLHAHSPALNGVAALRIKKKYGIPVVYEVRAFWEDAAVDHRTSREGGLRYRLTRALETYVLKRADAVTTICEGLRRDIIDRGVNPEKVTVIPNAVDTDAFHGANADQTRILKEKLGLQDCTLLGFIGSFYAYEGLALLIEALPRILLKAPDVRLLLVGGGPENDRLKALVRQLDLHDKVIFTGRVPHEQVSLYYEMVDIFVYPRMPMRLTELVTPLKPLEAMAQSRLVIASDVGGHKELIRDHETGILFKAGDADALATAALDLLKHKERWPAQRVAARRFVEHERQWPAVVERYRDIYDRLVPKNLQKSPAVG